MQYTSEHTAEEFEAHVRRGHLLRVGDQVTVRIDTKDSLADLLSMGRRYLNGASAEVVGFKVKSVCRSAARHGRLRPGIYADLDWPCIRTGPHMVQHIRAEFLALPPEVLKQRLAASIALAPRHRDLEPPFLLDLPEEGLWEGDVVRIKSWVRQPGSDVPMDTFSRHPQSLKVSWVRWGDLPESVDEYPRYQLSDRLYQRSVGGYMEFELDLLERGNCWRLAHGEAPVFDDLAEEAVHHWMFSACPTKWLSPRTGEQYVRLEDALEQVRDGNAHGVFGFDEGRTENGRRVPEYRLITFADEAFGERVRRATLEDGFLTPCPSDETSSYPF